MESTGGFNPDPDADQSSRYSHAFTIKRVALVAAAVGLATAAYLVHSAIYAHGDGDAVAQDFASSGALSATLASTALIGRQLLSAPTVVNAIANQSVFANALFNLQIDFRQVFNITGNVTDICCSQANGAPLPDWLINSVIPTTLVGSIATSQCSMASQSLATMPMLQMGMAG